MEYGADSVRQATNTGRWVGPIVCDECSARWPAFVILLDELWLSICKHKKEFLCVDCIERRLGRRLTWDDLKSCWATDQIKLGYRILPKESNETA